MTIEAKTNRAGNETTGGSQASHDVPKPPDHIDGLTLKMWMTVASAIAARGLATEVNIDILADFCDTYEATHASCDRFILQLNGATLVITADRV